MSNYDTLVKNGIMEEVPRKYLAAFFLPQIPDRKSIKIKEDKALKQLLMKASKQSWCIYEGGSKRQTNIKKKNSYFLTFHQWLSSESIS